MTSDDSYGVIDKTYRFSVANPSKAEPLISLMLEFVRYLTRDKSS